jgi:heme/copper-type cytochrome/quinol oxidase subunit 2
MDTTKTKQKPVQAKQVKKEHQFGFVFTKINLYIMFVGIAFLVLGYLLMVGGKSNDPAVFSDAIFNTQRLVVAPILLVIGFVIEIFAIMYRSKTKTENTIQ